MSQEPEDQGVGLPLYPLFSPNGKAGRRPAGASAPPGAIAFGRGPKPAVTGGLPSRQRRR